MSRAISHSMSRRLAIQGGAATALTLLAGIKTSAGESADENSIVWRGMTQEQLNDTYSQSGYTPNIPQILARWRSWSDEVRARIGEPQRYAYGRKEIEGLDVYSCNEDNAPIHVMVHGGAWQQGVASTYGFAAEMHRDAGIHYVVPDFSWVQDVDGDLTVIANQLRRALAWVYQNAAEFGGNPRKIYLSGHSSGGHLAGVLLTTDWAGEFRLPADIIKGGVCVSGMFDLEPVRLSHCG